MGVQVTSIIWWVDKQRCVAAGVNEVGAER